MTQVNNEFNIQNNGIMVDNKLIIKSTKTLKKMNFLLNLMIEKYTDKLLNYYKLKYIENFYTEIKKGDIRSRSNSRSRRRKHRCKGKRKSRSNSEK